MHEATRNEEVEPIAWGPEREKAFQTLKTALLNTPALGLPDYIKPFKLYGDEIKGTARGLLVQILGPHERPVAYFSVTLGPVVKGTPSGIRAIAAEMVEKSRSIILGHALTVCVPQEVEIFLKQCAEKSLSPQRACRYELALLLADNLKLERCNTLNPATVLPLPTDDEKDTHDCTQILTFTSKSRDDRTDQPLDNLEMSLFTDGSSYYDKGRWMVGFAVTTETTVLIAGPLPLSLGAQCAEVVALTEAAKKIRCRLKR